MRDLGLEGARRGKKIRTTLRDDGHQRAVDLLRSDFTASRPNERWVADFTYVATWSGIVYVAFVADVFFVRDGVVVPQLQVDGIGREGLKEMVVLGAGDQLHAIPSVGR
ncbi:hypothetical protein [Streptomyces longisporus]